MIKSFPSSTELYMYIIIVFASSVQDMNEPANFVNGNLENNCPRNKLNNPPYVPREYCP